jgi:hypothetical protein
MPDNCWLCDRPLSEEDKEREVPEEYKRKGTDKPCINCYDHMVAVDFKEEEWA